MSVDVKCDGWYDLKQQIMLVYSLVSRPHSFNYDAVGVISGGAPEQNVFMCRRTQATQ